MAVHFRFEGESRSFPDGPVHMAGAGTILAGPGAGGALAAVVAEGGPFIAVELGAECLGEHIGLDPEPRFAVVVGFARFRLGTAEPTALIELVTTPATSQQAAIAAKAAFESAGYKVAMCADVPGRIVDRLIRPYFNAVLRRLDEGLASAEHMDMTLRLGLGYPEGPNALLERTGLAHHHDVTAALYAALGDRDFAPARRARIAKARSAS